MSDPRKIVVAGDWHGNTRWAIAVIDMLPELLPDEEQPTILHTGDFGIWSGSSGTAYLAVLNQALERVGGKIIFVDGNHEDFSILDEVKKNTVIGDWPLSITPYVAWAPRGHRWSWQGREWLAVGGAVSVDRALRHQGFDWWPAEEISEADQVRVVLPGHADVMVCHDAPSTVDMRFGPWPSAWSRGDQERSDRHRDRLQSIVDEVRPQWLFHGHYHRFHDQMTTQTYGQMRVIGLDMDGGFTNFVVLDVEKMELVQR